MHAKNFLPLTALLLLLTAGQAETTVVPPPAFQAKIETGVIYSRGDYGLTEDTTVLVAPFSLSYEGGPWTWRVTVPWLMIDGPASVIADSGAGASGPERPTTENESGLGDSTVSLTYKLNPGADHLNVDLTGRIKLPTGDDDRGIGTGEIDTYAQVDLYRTYGGITPFGSIGYRWLGDGRYLLEDGAYASGGLLFTIATGTSIGVSYEWRDAIVDGGDDAREASVFMFKRLNDRWNLNVSVMRGFTDSSADFGAGAQLSYSF